MTTLEAVELRMLSSPHTAPSSKNQQMGGFGRTVKTLPALGLLLALLSSLFLSTAGVTVKLTPNVHPMMLLLGRSLFHLVFALPPCIYYEYRLFGEKGERLTLLLCGVFGTVGLAGIYFAISLLPLPDAAAIFLSNPAFTTLFACLLLKESCGVFNVASVVSVAVGVVLVIKPTFLFGGSSSEYQLEGSLAALLAAITQSVFNVLTRKLRRTPTSVVLLSWSVLLIVCCGVYLIVLEEMSFPLCGAEGMWFVLSGVTAAIGMFLLIAAYKVEKAGPVSVCRAFDIVMAFIFQISLFGHYPTWNSILGTVIIFSTVVAIGLKKWYKEKPSAFSCRFLGKKVS